MPKSELTGTFNHDKLVLVQHIADSVVFRDREARSQTLPAIVNTLLQFLDVGDASASASANVSTSASAGSSVSTNAITGATATATTTATTSTNTAKNDNNSASKRERIKKEEEWSVKVRGEYLSLCL